MSINRLLHSRNGAVVAVWLLMFLACSRNVAALDSQEAIDAAGDGLSAELPWYDQDTGRVRRVDVKNTAPPAQPGNWEWRASNSQGPDLRWLWEALQVVVWVVLGLLFVVVAWLLIKALLRNEVADLATAGSSVADDSVQEVDRIENLPFQVRRPRGDLLGEARRHYDAGNFGEAIIYLFSYQLVQLDKSHLIRLAKGKTNRQYLREVRSQRDLGSLLAATMFTFEDVFFGNHRLGRSRFESCWNRLDDFHHLLGIDPKRA